MCILNKLDRGKKPQCLNTYTICSIGEIHFANHSFSNKKHCFSLCLNWSDCCFFFSYLFLSCKIFWLIIETEPTSVYCRLWDVSAPSLAVFDVTLNICVACFYYVIRERKQNEMKTHHSVDGRIFKWIFFSLIFSSFSTLFSSLFRRLFTLLLLFLLRFGCGKIFWSSYTKKKNLLITLAIMNIRRDTLNRFALLTGFFFVNLFFFSFKFLNEFDKYVMHCEWWSWTIFFFWILIR